MDSPENSVLPPPVHPLSKLVFLESAEGNSYQEPVGWGGGSVLYNRAIESALGAGGGGGGVSVNRSQGQSTKQRILFEGNKPAGYKKCSKDSLNPTHCFYNSLQFGGSV